MDFAFDLILIYHIHIFKQIARYIAALHRLEIQIKTRACECVTL